MRIKKGKDFLLNLITTMVIKIQPCSFGLEWFGLLFGYYAVIRGCSNSERVTLFLSLYVLCR